MLKKNMIYTIIILLIGVIIIPSISGNIRNYDIINDNYATDSTFGNILVYITEDGRGYRYDKTYFDEGLPLILQEVGYLVNVTDRETISTITDSLLASYDELWILSTNPYSDGCFSPVEIDTILNFRDNGNGLLIMVGQQSNGQNYQVDGNQISIPLGVTFNGITNHGPPSGGDSGEITPTFTNHPLFTGVESINGCISEGNMIVDSHIEIVATYEGDNLIAVLDDGKGRVVFDVSEQRLWDPQPSLNYDFIWDGDTPQYVINIADWLINKNLKTYFFVGIISHLNADLGAYITFEADIVIAIGFSPFQFNLFSSGEKIRVSDSYIGIITPNFISGLFKSVL